jgi:hypothetical protein
MNLIEENINKDLTQLELKFLTEEEKKYDLNNDGVLDEQEKTTMNQDKLLTSSGISSWRKKKLRDYLDGKQKHIFKIWKPVRAFVYLSK